MRMRACVYCICACLCALVLSSEPIIWAPGHPGRRTADVLFAKCSSHSLSSLLEHECEEKTASVVRARSVT